MKTNGFALAFWVCAMASSALAQPAINIGDVVATSSRPAVTGLGEPYTSGNLVIFGRDGQFEGELVAFSEPPLSDPLVRDGIIYVATRTPPGIQRFTFFGQQLTPFTEAVDAVNFLAPGPNGGLLATNGSCELYQFAADGSLVNFRNSQSDLPSCGGIELAGDGCTVYWTLGGAIVRWNACLNTPPELATSDHPPNTFGTLRLLADGTFLVDMQNDAPILHLDEQGNVIRTFGIRGKGLALDIDGTSFWTNEFGWITRVDIATGTILSSTNHGQTYGLSVVGEPRSGLSHAGPHPIPSASTWALGVLIGLLVAVAAARLA